MVRVRDDSTLWSQQFNKQVTDIFAIQDEISLAVVNQLRLNLGRGRRRYETNLETYALYLRARTLSGGIGPGEYDLSIQTFQQVIARDPSFAPAYAGLA